MVVKNKNKNVDELYTQGCFAEFDIRDIDRIRHFLEKLNLTDEFDLLISIHPNIVQFYGINKKTKHYEFLFEFCGKKPKRFFDYIDFLWIKFKPKETLKVIQYIKKEHKNIKKKKEVV